VSGKAFLWAEATGLFLRLLKKPYILSLRGGGLLEFAGKYPGRVRRLLSGASAVTTPSRFLYQHMSKFHNDIQYLPNGLELNQYSFRLRTNPLPKLCWLRAYHKIYNPTMAVEAVALLKETFPEILLMMIGPDKQ
ncbi:unnamed protein product, partial [marine sediment metagenome]